MSALSHTHASATWTAGKYFLLMAAAFWAGTLNAVAGGGSFFSFPTLVGFGLPPVNANATNTVALWPGQLASMVALRKELYGIRHFLIPAMICAGIGGFGGARTLLITDQRAFLRIIPWLLLFATVLFAISGKVREWLVRRARGDAPGHAGVRLSAGLLVSLVLVCFYIGYFGAGAGFLLFALFALFGFTNFHELNVLKILCNAVANGIAVTTFIVAHAIYWRECLVMLLLAAAGGYFGAAYSRRLHPAILRTVVITAGFLVSAYFFWKTAS